MSFNENPKSTGAVRRVVATLLITSVIAAGAFAQADKKVATAVLIDNTGSMRSQFNLVIDLSKGVAAQAQTSGPVKLFNFMTQGSGSSGVALISSRQGWTEDKGALATTIDDLYVVPGQTKLLDAITSLALDLNEKVALNSSEFSGKVIFLVTDGEDRSSKIGTKELIKLLQDSGIQVNAIGLIDELNNDRFSSNDKRSKAKHLLESLTKETGGRVVFAERHGNAEEVLRRLWNK